MESREPYSLERIEELYEHLVFRAQSGQPIDYEIRVDHLVVVQRTNDPERFHEFEAQLRDTTRELYIVFFKGTSRKSDKHCFVLQEAPKPQSFQQQLEEAIRKEKEAMLIRLEMNYLRKKVKSQKRTIKDLKRTIEQSGTNGEGIANVLKELSSSNVVKDLFKGKTANADSLALGALPNDEIVTVVEHYRSNLGEETFQALLGTMLALAQSPRLIPEVREFITSKQ